MKKLIWFFILVMVLGTFGLVIFRYDSSRILTYLAVIPVLLAPWLLRGTKYQLGDKELCCYYIFIFLADFLGCVVNLYNMIGWYDLFVHFLSGIFTFGVGLFVLRRIFVGECSVLFEVIFSICLVMMIASLWEFFEFGADWLLGMDLQHTIDTGVWDTMEDMIVAFLGGILSGIGYYLMNRCKRY